MTIVTIQTIVIEAVIESKSIIIVTIIVSFGSLSALLASCQSAIHQPVKVRSFSRPCTGGIHPSLCLFVT